MTAATSSTVFSAIAFHSSLPEGRAAIELRVDSDCCSFSPPNSAGESTSSTFNRVRLPLTGLKLERGGANNRMVFLSHPSFPAWQVAVSDPAFVKVLTSLNHDSLHVHLREADRVHKRGVFITFAVLVALFGGMFGLYQLKEPLVRGITNSVPLSWEQEAGSKLFALHRASGEIIEEAKVKESLARFIEPLMVELKKTGYDPKVFIQKSDELNAFALPGGYVVLNSEVLEKADSPEEVLGVLAHEFAHVSERHVLRGLISTLGIYFGVSIVIGDYAGSLAAISDALPYLINLSFSRDYEREADDVGFAFMLGANINPTGMVSFFKKVAEEEKKLGAISEVSDGLSFLSTHPNTVERIAALEEKLKSLESSKKSSAYLELTKVFEELKSALKDHS